MDGFTSTARFQILSRLGMGGMGVVYEAFDHERGQRVALKTLHSVEALGVVQLKNEFRRLQQIQHPNVARLFELHAERGRWFFTMELVDGVDAATYIRGQARPPHVARPTTATTVRVLHSEPMSLTDLPPPPFDEDRLRAVLRGLTAALSALHGRGIVHLDVKPGNVLVSAEGRVVLLDFGLAAGAGDDPSLEPDHLAGTPAYMAPEQIDGAPAAPAADWYAVGVLLFETMTGQRPTAGHTHPRALAPDVPADLDELAARLLERDPGRRAGAAEIAAAVGAQPRRDAAAPDLFVGRAAELTALADAFADARAGQGVAVLVTGEAGLGKTALLGELLARTPDALAFATRCHERESVPFRALDGIVDAIGRHLLWLPERSAQRLLPPEAELLARLFPSLRRVPAFGALPVPATLGAPAEVRAGAFRGLRDLLERLAAETPVILAIDDLHWADADSRALLEVLASPAPPRHVLLVGASRDPALPWLPPATRRLVLGALAAEEATELARLLAPAGSDAEAIARASAGHPLFVAEIARHADRLGAALRLEDALGARVDALATEHRELLELVAVAGSPVATGVLAAALGAPLWDGLDALLGDRLVRASNAEDDTPLRFETYHDRLRDAVVARLTGGARRQRHERLALALERAGGDDPELLARSWLGAGEAGRAAPAFATAGHRAADALAFEQAALLYGRALACGLPGSDRAWVEERLGDVFAARGDTARAIEHYAGNERSLADSDVPAHLRVMRKRAELERQRGHVLEAEGVLDDALAAARAAGLPLEEGRTLHQLARVAMYRADYDTAEERARSAAALAARAGSPDLALQTRLTLANVAIFRGDPLGARDLLESGASELELASESTQAELFATRGRALLHGAAYAEATPALDEAAARFHRLGLTGREAGVLNNLGAAAFYLGDWDRAAAAWERFVAVCARREDLQDMATGLNNLAHLEAVRGELTMAGAHLDQALAIAARAGRPHIRGLLLGNRAEVHLLAGELDAARAELTECATLFAQLGAREDALETIRREADLALAEGDAERALLLAAEAAVQATEAGLRLEATGLRRVQAAALRRLGRLDEAGQALAQARVLAENLGFPLETARLALESAELAAARGDASDAALHADAAHGIFVRLGATPLAERAARLAGGSKTGD